MKTEALFVATLFLVLGPPSLLALRSSIGRSSVSLVRSSSRSSYSSISSYARSSSAVSTYGGYRYTVISARTYVYGYSSYSARGSGNNDPTVCFNNGSLLGQQDGAGNESMSLGYYVCPLPEDSDSLFCCCGPDDAQYCCSSWDYTMMYYSGQIFGAAGAGLVLIAFCIIVYLKRKYKRRISAARHQENRKEAAQRVTQSPPRITPNTDYGIGATSNPPTFYCPPQLPESSQVPPGYPYVQGTGNVQLPQGEGNASSQVPQNGTLPPKYEDVVWTTNGIGFEPYQNSPPSGVLN